MVGAGAAVALPAVQLSANDAGRMASIDIVALCLFTCVLWLLILVFNSELQLGMWHVRLSVYMHTAHSAVRQGRLWFSFAPCVFPGLIIGRKFSKLRQSTAFYILP